jgi:hypothetical protein
MPMTVTMAFPDNLELHTPIFHLEAAWLAASGVLILAG